MKWLRKEPPLREILHGIDIKVGEFEKEERPYLYISVPGQGGFLLEPMDQYVALRRATGSSMLTKSIPGQREFQSLFFLQGQELERFIFLDQELLRGQLQDKTFSLPQLSEALLVWTEERGA